MATRKVQTPGAATQPESATDNSADQNNTTDAATQYTAPIATVSPDLNDQQSSGAYVPEQLASDDLSELERLRTENALLRQQQTAQPAIITNDTGPAPTAPAAANRSKGGGTLTEHGWIVD